MKIYRILAIALVMIVGACQLNAHNPNDLFYFEVDQFFKKYVDNGKVDYASIKEDPALLDKLVEDIAAFELHDIRLDFPFYVNAYNILVIKQVVDHYLISSPMGVTGFFDQTTFKVAGKEMTLNDLENKVIRPTYQDARIHFALVCAAISCPKLYAEGFKPENFNRMLSRNTTEAMNDPTFIRVKADEKLVEISKIFEWYKEDFGESDFDLINFINRYRKEAIPKDYSVGYYEYDWKLNGKMK